MGVIPGSRAIRSTRDLASLGLFQALGGLFRREEARKIGLLLDVCPLKVFSNNLFAIE